MPSYKTVKTIVSLCTSLLALTLAHFEYYQAVPVLVGTYLVGDLFFVDEFDMLLHHSIILLFLTSTCTLSPRDYLLETHAIINLEISTVFLALNHLMQESRPPFFYKVNQYIFLATFTKYRIWDYYWVFIYRESFPSLLAVAALNGLFALNIYWFYLIYRKATKSLHTLAPAHRAQKTEVLDPCFSGTNAS
jgi:hypothetical protein